MIDQLIKLVRQNAGNEIVKNPAIPDQYNDEAIKDTGAEIYNGLQAEAKGGNVGAIASLFKDDTASGTGNPVISNIISNVAAKFASKFGISPEAATKIASGLVPRVVKQFTQKAKDPNDTEFDLQDILKSLTGNDQVGDLIGKFTGENKNGGLSDLVGGFLKK